MRPALIVQVLSILLAWLTLPLHAADLSSIYPQIRNFFPHAESYGGFEGTPPSAAVFQQGKIIGYVFLTDDVLRIPAYSGKPINTLIGFDLDGRITGLSIVYHDEPILAVGITQERLNQYIAQYEGRSVFERITVGARRPGYVAIDGISGATITVMVINATVMRSVRQVAEARGIFLPDTPPARRESAGGLTAEAFTQPAPVSPAPAAVPAPLAAREKPAQAQPAPRRESPKEVVRIQRSPDRRVDTPPAAPRSSSSPADGQAAAPVETTAPPVPAAVTTQAATQEDAIWVAVWRERIFETGVLVVGLATLFLILVFQDWLARHPTALTYVRHGFHFYTLFFIGWYGLAQLSVINVLTFVDSVTHGFRWENFLIDPMLFILWSFVAVTLLLWGRGVYCGWLCPFGALQELTLEISRRLKLPEYEFPDVVHERLWAVKYIVLILLFGVSLQSMAEAARYAEIEPFKTVIALRFQREWPFLVYAFALIAISFFNRKFFCKYLCPLGAALAIPGRFRLFEWWLRRRKECGKPCQVCSNRCSVRAIRPTGEINANECHYCLDCQVIYYNDQVCLPLIDRRKRREQKLLRGKEVSQAATESSRLAGHDGADAEGSAHEVRPG
jgi:polyferredoxin